ncbi:MAG: glucose 1-dehydrogenase [Rhodospirillaceae bacterium]|jgi:NAD(P)-dependent dehydrogenase (short-subunit alcohol dehydrogenase family)|nr:glucose 1-dehydrogenase [Rhodospirillaceae bacterium]
MPQLEDKVAIITGAAQGIGRAVAKSYVQEGAKVVVADLLADEAAVLCDELNSEYGSSNLPVAIPVATDVSDKSSVNDMVARTLEAFGRIDILVNNAALWKALERAEFWTIPEEEWDQVFAVNTRGPFLCSSAVTPIMQEQNKGKIICIGSATIWTAQATLTHYVSSKAALIGMVRCMARDLGPHNICVNLVHPGITDTGGTSREYLEERSKRRFIPRVQEPTDLTGACVFFGSDASDFVTGQQLNVDGGIVMA